MSAPPDQGPSKGKATDSGGASNGGFRPQANMTVEPPKPEDLQKSYASVIDPDSNPKGWYGSMGEYAVLDSAVFLGLPGPSHPPWSAC